MRPDFNTILSSMPTKTSSSNEWVAWDRLNRSYFGKNAAKNIFAVTWKERGKGTGANVEKVREGTGYPLENESLLDEYLTLTDDIGDMIAFGGTINKVLIIGGLAVGFVLIGGIVYRVVTATAQEAGTAVGAAARYAATKGA